MGIWKFWIWPGLAAVGCLTALAIWFEAPGVEVDLQKRAVSALRQDHGWAQVSLKGRDLTLTGIAPDEASQSNALELARQTYGVRIANDASTLLPEESPYRLTIEKTADGVSLSGFVPNESARANIISILTGILPGIALSDQMRLARGAPEGLVSLAGYGLAAFPRFSTGSIEITDRAIAISGQALDPEDHDRALAAVSTIPASAGEVSSVDIKPAAISGDYVWSASIGPNGLNLAGYAPDPSIREAILERAKAIARERKVENGMLLASGVPGGVDWQAAADEALLIVSELAEGTAIVRGNILDLTGQALDADAFRRIQRKLDGGFRSGLVLGTADIGAATAASFEWAATREEGGLSLTGALPSEEARARLLAVAGLKFGKIEIEDRQEVSAGAPNGLEAAVLVALQALSRLKPAEARIIDGTIFIDGVALNATASRNVMLLLSEGLPDGFEVEHSIALAAVPDIMLAAPACQMELNRLTAQSTVLFETGEAVIQDHSYGLLDQIAFVARQCGEVRLEISGHTDADGSEADNLVLSEQRARAVIDFLVAAGVSADRMISNGYGESRPLESNETDAGKAANRRIEFRVLN